MRRWGDVEPDDIAQLGDKQGIVGELELSHPVWRQTVGAPDPLHRTGGDAGMSGHHLGGPVRRLARRVAQGQGDDAVHDFGPEWRDARRSRLVAKQALEAFLGEAFLPTPHTSLRLAGAAHDLIGADAVDAEQDNLGPPDMLLGGIAVPDQRREATAARRRNVDGDTGAHPQNSTSEHPPESPTGTLMLGFNH